MVQYQQEDGSGGGGGLVAPVAVKPKLVRPKAMRPSHSAMLARIAQDFQDNPPPNYDQQQDQQQQSLPITSIEIVNVPSATACSSRSNPCKTLDRNETESTTSTSHLTTSTISVSLHASSSGSLSTAGDAQTFTVDAKPSVGDAKKRLRARRTLSETNFDIDMSQITAAEEEQQEAQTEEKKDDFIAPPQGLTRPKAIRPKAIKAGGSNSGSSNNYQLSHGFSNQPITQISLLPQRAPSAPPLQQGHEPQRPPSVAPLQPVMAMPMPQPVRAQPQRPRPRRQSSSRQKSRQTSWYHRVAAKNKLGSIQEDPFLSASEDEDDEPEERVRQPIEIPANYYNMNSAPWERIQAAKTDLLQELNRIALLADAESNHTPAVQAALQTLISNYDHGLFDPRAPVLGYHPYQMQLEGIGISAGKPTFPGCIGHNPNGDPMYRLGTMSFDMFRPTELVVSVQGTFCLIDGVDRNNQQELQNVPKNLLNDVRHGINPVRHYNIVTPFTIEAYRPEFGENSPNRCVAEPINGVMTTYGFILPYPTGNRFSVWFVGGSLEVDGHKNEKWFQIFDKKAAPRRTAFESGKVLAAKLLMGACVDDEMDKNGTLSYTLTRPVASYIDLVYLDNSLQVLRGSSGTVYVHVRLPGGSSSVDQATHSDLMLPAPVDPLESHHMSPSHRYVL